MNKINMTTEIKLLTDFKNKLSSIQHPNISIEIFPPDKRLGDFERADIIYPLTLSHFVLFNLKINNGDSIFKETSNYLFIYKHIFISSSMGLKFWDRSDGALDATNSSCKLLYEKSGIESFELLFNNKTVKHHLVLNINDGNTFRSVGFKSKTEIPDTFITTLNQSLEINKWL
jgi:hypothetical protein